jgi:hypothetical protein
MGGHRLQSGSAGIDIGANQQKIAFGGSFCLRQRGISGDSVKRGGSGARSNKLLLTELRNIDYNMDFHGTKRTLIRCEC